MRCAVIRDEPLLDGLESRGQRGIEDVAKRVAVDAAHRRLGHLALLVLGAHIETAEGRGVGVRVLRDLVRDATHEICSSASSICCSMSRFTSGARPSSSADVAAKTP